ncbi:phage prohead protease, HK97 family [Sphingobium faniae]|nr:phage prohead protease, HK97 family [Sphingobium faniae]
MIAKAMTIEKMDETGTGLARIAQLAAVDSDGDTYAPGAFSWKEGGGQWVQMIPAHDRRAMPFGKAWLYEKDGWAVADLNLNLDTQAGKDWHAALKFDLAKGRPVQEWSYGFNILDAGFEQREGSRVRVLKRLDVDEISPVLRGAGVGTGTLAIKSAQLKDAAFAPLISQLGDLADALGDDPSCLSVTGIKQLGEIHVAIGKALSRPAEIEAREQAATGAALAGYLKGVARRHLKV